MKEKNVLQGISRSGFRAWLEEHSENEMECWVEVRRGRPADTGTLSYLDAVEEALCFGWIDSTVKQHDGVSLQRFTPRRRGSAWTELNKERARRLIRLGRMTPQGKAVLPAMGRGSFRMDPEVMAEMKKTRCWTKFRSFPPLYQRIRSSNVAFYRKRSPEMYEKALRHLIEETKKGRMFGEWNDYGRLLDSGQGNVNHPAAAMPPDEKENKDGI